MDGAKTERLNWWLLLGLFALIIAAFIARTVFNSGTTPLLNDTDDAMRLTVIRDFLAGQGWYDLVQHRLNTPFGAEIHWSRLIDLPIAGLVLLLRPFAGNLAETIALYVWPLALLLVLLWLNGKLVLTLVGRDGILPALALPAFSLITMAEFVPGRIDHHSVQILLMLLTLFCSLQALERPRFAIGAGLAAATALAIGIDSLPFVGAAILSFGLMWVFVPGRAASLRGFGVSFGLATALHLGLAVPPERWLVPVCDAISPVYAGLALGTGLAFLLLSLLPMPQRPVWPRLLTGIGAGAALALALALLFPACLRGPYANLDPWLLDHWINRITEALPFWVSLLRDPTYPIAVGLPPLLAVLVVLWRVFRGPVEGRAAWLVYAVFLLLAVAAMLLQIRMVRLATSLSVPAGAYLIVMARNRYLATRRPWRVIPLIGSWLAFAGIAIAIVVAGVIALFPDYQDSIADPRLASRISCRMPEAFADLAALPPERIMAPIDLGAHLLAFTPHEVVAAPYHRNVEGVRDAFAFFNEPIDTARNILERRGIGLVVICPTMPEMRGTGEVAADSFVRLYPEGRLPAWLVDQSLAEGPLKVFAVMPR